VTGFSPFLRASFGLHAAAAAWLAAAPSHWPWVAAALAADHLAVVGASLLPRSRLLGPNRTRLGPDAVVRGEVALTFDDGPDAEVTPAVLDLLGRHDARATFFVVGRRVERHPELTAEITARGHGLGNHTHTHPHHFWFLGPGGIRLEIGLAGRAIERATGSSTRLFRAPAGIRGPWTSWVLSRMGLDLVSWTRRGYDAVRTDPERVAARLLGGLSAGDILLMHDGSPARAPTGRPVVLEALPRVLEAIEAEGLRPVPLPGAAHRGGRA
jgi:peptidoglycan-N-acetylglucosamine deacetylase